MDKNDGFLAGILIATAILLGGYLIYHQMQEKEQSIFRYRHTIDGQDFEIDIKKPKDSFFKEE